MARRRLAATLLIILHLAAPSVASGADAGETRALLALGAALDPTGRLLPSWAPGRDPCAGDFEGVACDARGAVANVSLQGKGLPGTLSPAVAGLQALTGLYLHYNALRDGVPRELAALAGLADLYLGFNNLSGPVPPEIGAMASLQVVQLCYNQLTGSIPTQLANLSRLTVLALQSNRLNGAIPASLGDLPLLTRLDLSFNNLFGSIPVRLARLPRLVALDVRNNSLTGSVPADLATKLQAGFQYGNNSDLCGEGLPALRPCTPADLIDPDRPQPFSAGIAPQVSPDADAGRGRCSGARCAPSMKAVAAVVVVAVALLAATAASLFALSWRRWRSHRIAGASSSPATTGSSTADGAAKVSSARKSSALASLEYSTAWDPLAGGGPPAFPREVAQLSTEEVESATRYFSELNLLGPGRKKGGFAATYRGALRDGAPVAVKRLGKTCCRQEEAQFVRGLRLLAELRHDNVVALRGFCCSRARGECYLVYDFVPGGTLAQFLDVDDAGRVLGWSTRISIIKGIAKGIEYLHSTRPNKPPLVHQSISADKILLDHTHKPLISGCGLHRLLVDDLVFSTLKASAAMGYLAPEYTTTGRLSEKSDVYAFGVIVLQVLTGRTKTTTAQRSPSATEIDVEELVDGNLMRGSYSTAEAAKLAKVAVACTDEDPDRRPTMAEVIQELGTI